nr:PREDICTED: echinoderm microtubule-associated protein-like 4 [Latimeria chalumnae]|eukprot:XP_014340286.1 PREDICTED: echinoderm microtubule-associated protein-like 4 [Latimeria chalumnae]
MEKVSLFGLASSIPVGRDSVQALKKPQLKHSNFTEATDHDLLKKIEAIFVTQDLDFEIEELRERIKERENGHNLISKKELVKACQEVRLPLHGPVLNKLMSRCDDENNGRVSWPDFLQFLAAALEGATVTLNTSKLISKKKKNSNFPVRLQSLVPHDDYTRAETAETKINGSLLTYCIPDQYQQLGPWVRSPPDYQLQLEWVYGYRGIDCHSNLFATKAGELVYFAGCIAVVYSAETKTQKHYCEHTAEIKSLALHPNKEIVATGQGEKSGEVMRQAHIRVWHTLTLQTLHVVGKKTFMSPIICLDFSQSLNHLVSIENNMNHVMCVWNFRTES